MSVPNSLNVNSIHLQFLEPLTKWRILDLKGLRDEIDYPSHRSVFEKTIRRLEKANVLKSFKDPWSNRKFVYLSQMGEKLVNDSGSPLSICEETIVHDAKVSQVTRIMMERRFFKEVTIEHQLSGKKNKGQQPDALILGSKDGTDFTMAFELELSKKSKDRIKTKIRGYLESGYYNYVFYMFCSSSIMKNYKGFIEEEFGKEAFRKLMFFWNPTILSRKLDLNKGNGYFKSKEVRFDEIFK